MPESLKSLIEVQKLEQGLGTPESDLKLLSPATPVPTNRFYRPELDALRFFAFFGVLLHHGPEVSNILSLIRAAGGFGLSMFFLLSGYLITELLLREKEQTRGIAWGLFFKRRALRIWPLYFAALAGGALIAFIPPHRYWVSPSGILLMSVFLANWTMLGSQLGPFVGHLWSISVEEQFYLLWPPVIKLGGQKLALAAATFFVASAGVWLWAFHGKGWKLWYDTPVEFLFFAAGAIIAIGTRGRPAALHGAVRGIFVIAGPFLLLVAAAIGGVGTDGLAGTARAGLYIGYVAAAAGCTLTFLAMLGMTNIPRGLIYLGKISYGLYVFHVAMLELAMRIASRYALAPDSTARMVVVDGLALILSVCAAHISYRYFEAPFLRLKERFSVVQSRPV